MTSLCKLRKEPQVPYIQIYSRQKLPKGQKVQLPMLKISSCAFQLLRLHEATTTNWLTFIRRNCCSKLLSSKNQGYKVPQFTCMLVQGASQINMARMCFITLKRVMLNKSHALFYHACKMDESVTLREMPLS